MKKKVTLSIIALILVVMVGYVYSIINGKKNMEEAQGEIVENSIVFNKNIDVESSLILVDLQMDSILGKQIFVIFWEVPRWEISTI